MTVISSREHDGRWIVGFSDVTSIDAAETLRGVELKIPAEEIGRLAPGGYYVHDLVGCRVEMAGGTLVGPVTGVQFGTGVPLLVIAGPNGEVLVPFTDAICRRVDVAGKLVAIDPPDGLLELNETARTRQKADDRRP
jgi:16S rRNA processing protein RimM